MLKKTNTKLALWITLIMTAVSTVLRVVFVPREQNTATGQFHLSYVVVAVMLLTLVASLILLIRGRKELSELPAVSGRWLLPISGLMLLVGLCIAVSSVVDMYNWAAYGIAPPPTQTVTGGADRITLFLSLAFGVLSGIYLIRLGLLWMRGNAEQRGVMQLWALMPTGWIWMRLARYEISFSSAVEVYEGFYDFAMLLLMMLFLFALARHTAAVGSLRPQRTLIYALGTALLALSGPVAQVAFYLLGEGDAYRAGQLAGVSDFAIGLLAAVLSVYWILTDQPKLSEPEEADLAADAQPEPVAIPTKMQLPEDLFSFDAE